MLHDIFNNIGFLIGTWGYIAVGAGSLIGGAISANGAKGAASSAANANLQNTQDTNAANLNLFNLSRGAPGSDGYGHAILPNYFGGQEQDLGQAAYQNFLKLNQSGQSSYNNLLNYQSQMRGSADTSINAINNRFNGQDLAQRQAFANPYWSANLQQAQTAGAGLRDVASANSSAINTGLQQALAQMNAQRAGQGYFGNSTFDRNRALSATLGARQQAAVYGAQANAQANNLYQNAQFQNSGDLRSLQTGNLDYQSNPSVLPGALSAISGYESAPANALSASFNNAMTPLNYFRTSPQSFQQQNMPMQTPGLDSGQVLGSAIQQGGSASLNYLLSQRLASQYGQGGANPYSYGSGMYGGSLTAQPSFMSGASAFSNPYAPAAAPSGFNYQMPNTGTSLYSPPPFG